MNREKLSKEQGKNLTSRYMQIFKLRNSIVSDLLKLIRLCVEFRTFHDDICSEHKARVGKWMMTYAPKLDHRLTKAIVSVANRTKNVSFVESWQMRILGILTPVHHKDRPISPKRPNRKAKSKSWIYHIGKAQDVLERQMRELGGPRRLTSDERAAVKQQLGPIKKIIRIFND